MMGSRTPIPGVRASEEEAGASILFLDDPAHSRIRTPLAKALYKRVSRCRDLVQRLVDARLEALVGRDHFDAVADFAIHVPIDVIAGILGVENARLTEFRAWSEGAILALSPFRTAEETKRTADSLNALSDYFAESIAARRRQPQDDLITDMVQLQASGEAEISDGELSNNLQGLLIGGNLTTTDLMANAIWLFLTHPDQLARLKAEPDLIANAVEEVLRHEGPVDITARIAPREMEVGGCPIHQSQSLTLSLRAANHDPAVFPDPLRFDITRKDAPHVAFGGGAHLCIGSPLARLQAQVAILSFFARFPTVRLADPHAPPHWSTLPFFRGLKALPLAL